MIALICDAREKELTTILSEFDNVKVFQDGTMLAYYLEAGNICRLAVVAKDGAEGMNDCSYISNRKTLGAVLWITEQEEFINQSKRMEVSGFLVKPVNDKAVRITVQRLLMDNSKLDQWICKTSNNEMESESNCYAITL